MEDIFSPHSCPLLPTLWYSPDYPTLQNSHDDTNKQEHLSLRGDNQEYYDRRRKYLYLLHGGESKPDVGEEGEGELHPRVEEEVDEVGQAYLLQVFLLLLLHVGDAGKPEQLQGVQVVIRLGEGGGCAFIPPASREGLLGWKDKTRNNEKENSHSKEAS